MAEGQETAQWAVSNDENLLTRYARRSSPFDVVPKG
jgi:hypothetical protein